MRLFGSERIAPHDRKAGHDGEDRPLEAGMLTKQIEDAQKRVEGRNYAIRKQRSAIRRRDEPAARASSTASARKSSWAAT